MTPLTIAIEDRIKVVSNIKGYVLSQEDFDLLRDTLVDKVERSIAKYIEGGMEHNPEADPALSFLTTVDHLQELRAELIDADMYLAAAIRRYQGK